jgi:hypothetical protein
MKRPTGVTVLSWLAIIAGAAEALASLGYLGFSAMVIPFVTVGSLASYGVAVVTLFGLGMLALGIAAVVFGIGALGLRSWAWPLGVTVFGIDALLAVVEIAFAGTAGLTVGVLGGLLLAIGIVTYLNTDKVRGVFGRSHHEPHATLPTAA